MIEPASPVLQHLRMGEHMLAIHAAERAIEHFRAALTLEPDNPRAHALLALALSMANRHEAAAHEAGLALQIAPDVAHYHYIQGYVFSAAERWQEAIQPLRTALGINPYEAAYHSRLAAAYQGVEKHAEAEQCAFEALALDPDDVNAHLVLGQALVKRKRFEEAKWHLEQAAALDPEAGEIQNALGIYYLNVRDNDRALQHIRESLRLNPAGKAAKHNFVLAMGAKNWFFGLFWRWSLLLGRLPPAGRIGVIVGLYVGMNLLQSYGDRHPAAKPAIAVAGILYAAFCIYTWIAPWLFTQWLKKTNQV